MPAHFQYDNGELQLYSKKRILIIDLNFLERPMLRSRTPYDLIIIDRANMDQDRADQASRMASEYLYRDGRIVVI